MNFADTLDAALERTRTPALVGIDPHLSLLPEEFAVARNDRADRSERADALVRFGTELIDVVAGRVAAVKPQAAFFELLGAPGTAALEVVCTRAREAGLLVIGDVKRSDISSTAAAYAEAYLADGPARCDAITVNPFLGPDTLEPFVQSCREHDAGLFVLLRTSNPGGAAFQLHGDPPLWRSVALAIEGAGRELVGKCGFSSVGAVVGATHPDELAAIRAAMPTTPFLLPGYGAQGAGASDVVAAFQDPERPWRGGLVNSSRGVSFAWRKSPGTPWKDAASRALDYMIAELADALSIPV